MGRLERLATLHIANTSMRGPDNQLPSFLNFRTPAIPPENYYRHKCVWRYEQIFLNMRTIQYCNPSIIRT